MATIFGKQGDTGPVGKIITADAQFVNIIKITGLDFDEYLLATGFSNMQSQVVSYLKTLNGHIYGYTWGDDVGKLTASGIVLCSPKCSFSSNGLSRVKSFYEENNVYNKEEPVIVSIGELSFEAYLTQYEISLSDSQYNLGEFRLAFDILPKK